ncbi:hypothetical protein QHF84_37385, partial [Polyangium sp. y55x31]|nr:hypothetical protein [Polyangium sp. y55x31]
PPPLPPAPQPPPVAETPHEAAAAPPPPVPAAPEPPAPAAPAPAPAAEAAGSGDPEAAAAPQPGHLAAHAATVPQKQAPRAPSVPPKAPAPASIHKPGGPATTPSPPVAEPRPEPKTQPPVIKTDAPPPEAAKVTVPKPAPGGISPAARRALSDTLQSPIAASALRVPKPPTVATQPTPEKEPAWAVPPPAKTAPAVPDAMKRSGTTMPPPAPPRPAAATTAGRAALAALKPDAAQPAAEAPKPAPPPAPAAAAAEPAPNSSGPPRIGDVMLEAIEPLTDLPEDVQRALSRAAKIEELGPSQSRALGVMLVITGEVSVYADDATVPGHVAGPRSFLTSRGSLEGGFAMHFVTGASGAKIASWDDATFDHALRSCPWVLDDCKATADRLQARTGLAIGALGGLDAKTRDSLATRLDMRVIEPGEVVTQENDPMPGLIFVVGGGVDIQEGDPPAVVGEARAGELLFADALWAGVPAPLTSRAKASGVLLLVADRKLALELAADVPLVAELLSR